MGYPPVLTQSMSGERSMAPTPNGGPRNPMWEFDNLRRKRLAANFRRGLGSDGWPHGGLQASRMSAEIPRIHGIYRYPVKGLSPEPLARTRLAVGETLPADRLYAIENGPSGFDPAAPRYQPKQRYLMLMRNERLARLRTALRGREPHAGDRTRTAARPRAATCTRPTAARRSSASSPSSAPTSCAGRRACCTRRASASPMLPRKVVSIINLASVAAIEDPVGVPVHPLALSRQPLRDGLAGLARVRSGRAGDRGRGDRTAQDRQAHRALRRNRRRSRYRHPRPRRSRTR